MRSCLIACLAALAVSACATHTAADGRQETRFDPKYLAKTDIDRVVDASRAQLVDGLLRIADKLYRRNPREWRKSGAADREAALARLRDFREQPPAALLGRSEGAAALQAFRPEYGGDRVEALIYGLLTMVDAAYGHKEEFFLLDSLDPQKLYNCARNLEIAVWKLAAARDAAGEAVLLSNSLDESGRNLSFEREFGRMIGILDLMTQVVADKTGRSVSRASQTLATTLFLPVGLLK